MKTVTIFPSNREVDPEIIDSLHSTDIAIVEAPGFKRPEPSPHIHVLSLEQQMDDFGRDVDLLGHGSAAVRNYGVWWAQQQGYDMVINLDDDCWPQKDFVLTYKQILTKGMKATVLKSKSGWTSTLHQEGTSKAWYPRGFPYEERARGHRQFEWQHKILKPVVHMGLWHGTLDLNAVDKYEYITRPLGPLSKRCYATQDHVPICAMNFACLTDWAPFIYQVPWTRFGPTLMLHRYDDIIGGLLTSSIARLENEHIGFGPPFVHHRKKDNNLLAHAAAENLGNVIISRLARLIEDAAEHISSSSRTERALLLLEHLGRTGAGTDLEGVTSHISNTYQRWIEWFA